jgi:hypothetical protein
MLIDTINLIPKKSLPRFQGDKRIWLDPVEFQIDELKETYKVSFWSNRGIGKRKFSESIPKKISFDDKFKCALVAYMCEGRNLRKGVYTKNSGNKGRNISFSNTDLWLTKLIVDEFEKLGIKRERWKSRLDLYIQHSIYIEKIWWSKKLHISIGNFKIREKLKGDIKKSSYSPHGICSIELYSVIFSALLDNIINLLKENKI